MIQDYHDFLAEVLIPEDTLQKRIAELGEQISHDYQGKNLLLVCILRAGSCS
jgi:hypoxanthine phosphoribosyltransferase